MLPAFSEEEYYSRQTRLAEVGPEGQAKLRAARVLIVGAGGLGCPALGYLAAAGIGTLGICEADKLAISNLHRQTLYDHNSVGQSKAALAAARIQEQNPFLTVELHHDGLTPENVLELFSHYDLVLDCTDNFPTKFMINDAAVISGTPAVFASIYQYEGQLMFVNPAVGGPCMRCLWPEMPEPGCVGSCAEVGVLGAVPGLLGTMQAMETLKHILGLPGAIHNALVVVDCLTYLTQRINLTKQPGCPVCGQSPAITSIERSNYLPPADIELDVTEMNDQQLHRFRLIDIREAYEVEARPLEGVEYEHLPMSQWDPEQPPITPAESCLLTCAHGIRSLHLAQYLRENGYPFVHSAARGWDAFHERTHR